MIVIVLYYLAFAGILGVTVRVNVSFSGLVCRVLAGNYNKLV